MVGLNLFVPFPLAGPVMEIVRETIPGQYSGFSRFMSKITSNNTRFP
jgi:hypothetical protein